MPSRNPESNESDARPALSTRIASSLLATLAGLFIVGANGASFAGDDHFGPDWVEDGDAGNTLTTALKVKGNGAGVVTINGNLFGGGGFLRGGAVGDYQDVFLIYIRDHLAFAAGTVGPGGQAAFDTSLWLFREDGRGLLGADDASEENLQTMLKGSSDQGAPPIPGPGVYGLAIGGSPTAPVSAQKIQMFPPPPPGVTVGPTKIGFQFPLAGWIPPVGATGSYRISLVGVGFIPLACGEGGNCFSPGTTPGCDDLGCCSQVCDLDPYCCDTTWDFQCASIAVTACQGCGDPSAGSCFSPHPQPFCNEASCCKTVCSIDPGCCDVEWDSNCAALAKANCTTACPTECPGDFNLDQIRDGGDLGILLGAWGGGGCTDIDGDGSSDDEETEEQALRWMVCSVIQACYQELDFRSPKSQTSEIMHVPVLKHQDAHSISSNL